MRSTFIIFLICYIFIRLILLNMSASPISTTISFCIIWILTALYISTYPHLSFIALLVLLIYIGAIVILTIYVVGIISELQSEPSQSINLYLFFSIILLFIAYNFSYSHTIDLDYYSDLNLDYLDKFNKYLLFLCSNNELVLYVHISILLTLTTMLCIVLYFL